MIEKKISKTPLAPDEDRIVLIKKGPTSMETSLKQLDLIYEKKAEWKVIKDGGVLSVPVEEFRISNPPKPDHSGNIEFGKKSGKAVGNLIESYPVSQTFTNLSEQVLMKYNAKKEKARAAGKSIINADAEAMATKLLELQLFRNGRMLRLRSS